ncbi:hypothetical protein B0I35DRAFT_477438 [Stachybotrys elegans]|uniref:Carboxylesterase family protein n=1 Tax=Stachybotrys elegans TaxID=80388 RepID=A0A8K0SZ80_9HYPO|nr:hypothetical protein B0I35DRAFT_477438 [Stachybotrys elegans]
MAGAVAAPIAALSRTVETNQSTPLVPVDASTHLSHIGQLPNGTLNTLGVLQDLRDHQLNAASTRPQLAAASHDKPHIAYPSSAASDYSAGQQILRHLAGQFDWVVSYPATASWAGDQGAQCDENGRPIGNLLFGCNLLSRNKRSTSHSGDGEHKAADTYTLVATPLNGDAYQLHPIDEAKALGDEMMSTTLSQTSLHLGLSQSSGHASERSEPALSPCLTIASDRSSHDGLSPVGSFSMQRIEDSLEELDRLEDELEAIHAVAQPERNSPGKQSSFHVSEKRGDDAVATVKRVSIAGPFATVRVKPSAKARPAVRPSSSLAVRSKPTDSPVRSHTQEQKAAGPLVRSRSTATRSSAPNTVVKSSKPLTVPSFELPGEAVARRLKEQREARAAQQAEAQKTVATPTRTKSTRQLTKPTFELPGEAISRRKREEREARLKAQEEEERKKREFKARPFRHTIGPGMIPRETLASLARQGKAPSSDDVDGKPATTRAKRMSLLEGSADQGPVLSTQVRGRNSMVPASDNASRATSTSTGSLGKRSSISALDTASQKLRGKAIFTRDNSLTQERQREKLEREEAARRAREEAAERSRLASREWAEKRRRRELAMKQAMQTNAQPRTGN